LEGREDLKGASGILGIDSLAHEAEN
jgi:hypothetical protein